MQKPFNILRSSIVLLAIFTLSLGPVVSAVSLNGIGGRPANPDQSNPRTQSIFIMQIDKGDTEGDAVRVVNGSNSIQTVELYAVDGMVTNTGAYTCRQENDARTGVGAWTHISQGTVNLKANSSKDIPFTVSMPNSADTGEHNGCIVIQAASQASSSEGGVNIQTRQAIRLAVTVPGELRRELSLVSFSVDLDNSNNPVYRTSLKNVGNVSTDADIGVKLKNMFGSEVYKNSGGYPVMSNQKLDVAYNQKNFQPLFGGWYTARATIKYSKNVGIVGVDLQDNQLSEIVSEDKVIFIPPSSKGLIIIATALIASLLATGIYLWRRSALTRDRRESIEHTVKRGETIQSIADDYEVDWKRIVVTNSIRPPYSLKDGQVIHVPKTSKD